ncbi:MAG TPA: hypothetical protein DIC64_00020, partial [Alphaproteobacteria bacterium]|nr:hypothetical protein [Alphaproteobacteria bacterium]
SRFSTVIEETCDISTPEIEQFLNQNKLVVFLNPLHFLSHPSALKAAERLQLQPHINLTEIKNGHQRL